MGEVTHGQKHSRIGAPYLTEVLLAAEVAEKKSKILEEFGIS
jgi:hypothetical protein